MSAGSGSSKYMRASANRSAQILQFFGVTSLFLEMGYWVAEARMEPTLLALTAVMASGGRILDVASQELQGL